MKMLRDAWGQKSSITAVASPPPAPSPSIVVRRAAALAASIEKPAAASPSPAISCRLTVHGSRGIIARMATLEAAMALSKDNKAMREASRGHPAPPSNYRVSKLAATFTARTGATVTSSAPPQAAATAHHIIYSSTVPKASAVVTAFDGETPSRQRQLDRRGAFTQVNGCTETNFLEA